MMLNKTFHLLLLSLIPLLGFSQANSQYPDSGNKIRLGFQTTGDGLIWRDTQPKVAGYQPINNKAAWIVLDTVNNKFYHYKRSNNTWNLAGGQDIDTTNLIATKYNLGSKLSIADTATMLLPYWRSGRFSGTLPVANGGTGSATQNFVDLTTTQSIGGLKTFSNPLTISKSSNSGSAATFPNINILNSLETQGNGSSTFNFASLSMGSGNDEVRLFLSTTYAAGTWEPAGLITVSTNHPLKFKTNNLDRMLITSTGDVGIGTTSPNYKLDISGTVNTSLLALRSSTNPSSNNYVGIDFGTGNFNGSLPNRSSRILGFADGGNDAIGLSFYTSNGAAPTEKMRIDKSGNVGIGVTPSAWASAEKAIQLPNDFVFAGGTNVGALFGINAFFDGSAYKYLSNAQAAILQTTKDGAFWFRRAPTGVAGNSATFGTSAYIDSTGNMILGNSTSPTEKLHVVGNARITGNIGAGIDVAQAKLHVKGSGTTSGTSALKVDNSGNTNLLNILDNGAATFRNISNSGAPATSGTTVNATLSIDNVNSVMTNIGNLSASPYSVWLQVQDKTNLATTYPLSLQPNGGNVGIGTASPPTNLTIEGTNRALPLGYNTGYGNIHIQTNETSTATNFGGSLTFGGLGRTAGPTEKFIWAVIAGRKETSVEGDTKGYLHFGTLNDNTNQIQERMRITSGGDVLIGTNTAVGISNGATTNVGISMGGGVFSIQVNNNANQYWSKASGYTSGDFTAHFVNNVYVGGITTNGSTTNYAVASDYRLKQDFKDFKGIDLVNKIKTYDYEWKIDKTRTHGVIAHELSEILPYAVIGTKDAERIQGVDYSKLVPILIKSVQELSAEIDILKQEIINLKNK